MWTGFTHILRIQRLEGKNSKDKDEVDHYEPPYQDLCYLQIPLFLSLAEDSHEISSLIFSDKQ